MAKSRKNTPQDEPRQKPQRPSNAPRKSSRKTPVKPTSKGPKQDSRPAPKAPKKSTRPAPPSRVKEPPRQEPKKEMAPTPVIERPSVNLDQTVAILVDGNNIEMSLHSVSGKKGAMINFDKLVPAIVGVRSLSRFIYFREGRSISHKLAERLQKLFYGSVVPCHKSADIPLSIKAVQIASKVDTIIILSGDADYIELVRHLKHDGIRVEIAAFPETTADILRQEVDYFFPITVEYSFVLK